MYQEQFPVFQGPAAKDALVIYHANCNDGFGAAWAFHRLADRLYDDVAYMPMNYGTLPTVEDYVGKDVFILDFSFLEHELRKIAALAARTTLLDHHKTAIEALSNIDKSSLSNYQQLLDNDRSGAMITWNYFAQVHPHGNAPQLIEYIQDRDLWHHDLPHTKAINALIAMTDKTFDAYNTLHNSFTRGQFDQCVVAGELLLKQYNRIVADIVTTTARSFNIAGYEGLVCNCPGHFASDVGSILAERTGTFGATYFAGGDGSHKFSLRSIGQFDVSAIAKQFGGGGHRNAAGFSLGAPIDNAAGSGVTLWNVLPPEEC